MRIVKLGDAGPITRAEFTETAKSEWDSAKEAYYSAHGRMQTLFGLIHKPGKDVRVYGRVTGAAYEAKQLRADVDRLIEALDEIVLAGKRVGS